jgi:hypothetical protein
VNLDIGVKFLEQTTSSGEVTDYGGQPRFQSAIYNEVMLCAGIGCF